jgi:tetratricopeptide (TPR) repeat protein
MGIVFNRQREYGKALEWYQRALDGYEKTLRKDHHSTLDTVLNMDTVFSNQGEYGKALEWYQRALDGREKTLGNDHPSTRRTARDLASVQKRENVSQHDILAVS